MILEAIKRAIFGTQTKKLRKHTRIRLTVAQYANLDTQKKEPVTIERHCILKLLFEKKGLMYFEVKSLFYSNDKFANDCDIITISRLRFNETLKYKIL